MVEHSQITKSNKITLCCNYLHTYDEQGTASKRNTAAESATYFVKVVRALLRSPPRGATVASAVEEDCDEAATDRIRKNREPRTALDVSGHRFAKNLQVREEACM